MKDLNFKLTEEEAQIVINGLATLPFKDSYLVIQKIQAQYNEEAAAEKTAESKNEVLTEEESKDK